LRIRQYDPEKPVSYLKLIDTVLRRYGDFGRPDDIVMSVGERRLTDVTHTPEMGDAVVKLYDGGDQRVFQFKESASRGGTIDVLFNRGRLESFRAQLYFEGFWAKTGAVVYSSLRFAPLMHEAVGRGNISFDNATHQFFCHYGNLVVSYTHQLEMGMPSISTTILAREGCRAGIAFNTGEKMSFSGI
jgi:hypothetical protein